MYLLIRIKIILLTLGGNMTDFKKIDNYLKHIENGTIPKDMEFNDFFMEFFALTQVIPLSKYIKGKNMTNKTPKIMNSKKAGEILTYSNNDPDVLTLLKRAGHKHLPQLNYSAIMVLRKVDLYSNWKRLLAFFDGKGTIQEINDSLRIKLLPQEVEKLESYIKEELRLSDKELNSLLSIYSKINKDKKIGRALTRLINQ